MPTRETDFRPLMTVHTEEHLFNFLLTFFKGKSKMYFVHKNDLAPSPYWDPSGGNRSGRVHHLWRIPRYLLYLFTFSISV
jgi:hypothetical protein